MKNDNPNNLILISPPGGIGQITAVNAAKYGSTVQWFVISPPSQYQSANVQQITPLALQEIQENDGVLQIAGANADTLLMNKEEEGSSLDAVSTWCNSAFSSAAAAAAGNNNIPTSLIVTMDGIDAACNTIIPTLDPADKDKFNPIKFKQEYMDAIKVATKEVTSASNAAKFGRKVVIVPSDMDLEVGEGEEENEGGGLLGNLFGKGVAVPKTLKSAMNVGASGSGNFAIIRYGELFGIPDSSPDASPFVTGPRLDPVIRDEYLMKSIRIDSTISTSGNVMMESTTRTSRLSIGDAAARMALYSTSSNTNDNGKSYIPMTNGLDICLTSLRGMEDMSKDEWSTEFERIQSIMSSGKGAQLYSANFGSIPSTTRLADWIATKWAPAVLKTYDIAGIRVGARPVYASRQGESMVEIVWQDMNKDFQTEMVGKMIIEVSESEEKGGVGAILTATRGPGDASKGYGQISRMPLPGEDILLRRLADAASQAVEKGLATKARAPKQVKKMVVQEEEEDVVKSTVVAVDVPPAPVVSSTPVEDKATSGPRRAGVSRSSERARGTRRRKSSSSSDGSDSSDGGSPPGAFE